MTVTRLDPFAEADALLSSPSNLELVSGLEQILSRHEAWRRQSINLDAAESISSRRAMRVLSSDFAKRAATGIVGQRHHRGGAYVDEVDIVAAELFKRLFRARHADVQVSTGSVANGIVIRALTEVGDPILRVQRPRAHPTFDTAGYAGHRGLRIHDIAVSPETFGVDLAAFEARVAEVRPTLVSLGSAVMLFPYDLRPVVEIAHAAGARVMYDGAHVMGLIAAGRFQDPLGDGVDVLTGTTYKSFSGPQGGLILYNDDEIAARLRPLLAGSGYVGTYNHARVLAAAITAAEWTEYGSSYADELLANAQALATSLAAEGLTVVASQHGYTRSHVVLLDVSAQGHGEHAAKALEDASIITMGMQLWTETTRSALRMAVTEMTRLGMGAAEMRQIAVLIRRVLVDREDPASVARDVAELRAGFQDVGFSFDDQ